MTEHRTPTPATSRAVQRGAFAVVAALTATVASFAAMSSPAQSTPDRLSDFNQNYGTDSTRLNSCMTCHTSGSGNASNVNPYGMDFAKSNYDFAAVETLDSDGDGFTNIDEINARTFPGDPADNPDTQAEPKPAPTTTTTRGPIPALPGLPLP